MSNRVLLVMVDESVDEFAVRGHWADGHPPVARGRAGGRVIFGMSPAEALLGLFVRVADGG